jgi:hypothetical protein
MRWSDAILSCLLIDRGKARREERSRQRIQSWIRDRIETTIQDLDQEADRLADMLEEYMKDKRKRDFEIRLLKGDLEKRKTYPRGVPPGPSPEELREQRERDAEKARKDAEHAKKCELAWHNHPVKVRQREVWAQLKIDPDFLRKEEAAKSKPGGAVGRNAISPEMQRKIRAAMARAEAAGRPITKLSLKIIQDIMHDRI